MFDFSKHFARRVFVTRTHSELTIAIRRHNDHLSELLGTVCSTAVFAMFLLVALSSRPQVGESTHPLRFLILAPFVLVYSFFTGIGLWRAFGTEEIIVRNGTFHWTRKALWWKRHLQAWQADVTDVVAKSNHVQFTVKGRQYSVGDGVLGDEAIKIALNLQYALKQPPRGTE
jgi:hypothetical protein